jgi:amidase
MNAFIRPLSLGDLDGPSLAIEDTIPVAGLKTILARDALGDSGKKAKTPMSRRLSAGRRLSSHAPAVRRALAGGWYIDTRVRHEDFGAAAAVAGGWVRAALAADFTGGLRVGAALHGICGYKPSYGVATAGHPAARTTTAASSLPMYCVGALAPDMQTLIDLAATLDDTLDEALTVPHSTVNVGWLASDHCIDTRDSTMPPDIVQGSYLSAKDWSKVQGLLIAACEDPVERAPLDSHDGLVAMSTTVRSRSRTVRLPGLADAAAAAALIASVTGRANEEGLTTPSPDDLARALHQARAFRCVVDHALSDVDVLALPTLHASIDAPNALTGVFNLSGHPAITLPFIAGDGDVQALQLIARHGDDARLLAAGRWFETLFARHPAAQCDETERSDETRSNPPSPVFSARTSGTRTPRWMTARAG